MTVHVGLVNIAGQARIVRVDCDLDYVLAAIEEDMDSEWVQESEKRWTDGDNYAEITAHEI